MAKPQYSMTEMIASIKRRATVPTSQLTFKDLDFTALCNDELQGEVIPLLMSTREEYFVEFVDVALANNEIEIPENAVGLKLRSVSYKQSGSDLNLVNLPRLDLDTVTNQNLNPFKSGFFVQGNKLIIYPSNSIPSGSIIRLYYYKRTLVLTEPNNFGQVVSIDTNTNTIQLTRVPSSWTTSTKLNSISQDSPFNITNEEISITSVSSPSIIVDSLDGISVGDYISEQGYSAIPQVPVEVHQYLAQLTAVKCLEAQGDVQGMKVAQAKADSLKEKILIMVSNRVDGSPKKIINQAKNRFYYR